MVKAGYRRSSRLDGYGFMSDDKPKLTRTPTNRAEKRKLMRAMRLRRMKPETHLGVDPPR